MFLLRPLNSPLQVAIHTAYVKELDLLPYLAVTTSTGAIQLWQGNIVQWTREEGLSRLQVAEMVELPEQKTMAAHAVDERDTFVERIRRQLSDAKVRFWQLHVGLNCIHPMRLSGFTPLHSQLCQKICYWSPRVHPQACSANLRERARP